MEALPILITSQLPWSLGFNANVKHISPHFDYQNVLLLLAEGVLLPGNGQTAQNIISITILVHRALVITTLQSSAPQSTRSNWKDKGINAPTLKVILEPSEDDHANWTIGFFCQNCPRGLTGTEK